MRRLTFLLVLAIFALPAQRYFPDDPLDTELKPIRVDDAARRKLSDYYDALRHTIDTPGELNRTLPSPVPAEAVNTLGEPMQGAWWVKRHYYRPMSIEELVAGPGDKRPPVSNAKWTVVGAKTEGVTPGFVIRDAEGELYFIKFDPISNPEMATGADHIAVRLVYALGYHVPENYLVEFSADQLVIGEDVSVADRLGRRRAMTSRDLSELLQKVPRTQNGCFRATASRAIAGKGIGPYRYYGVRRDDPNDFVPHEHRRDLRGLGVVAAWIGHDDSRALNTYDAMVEENRERFIKHFILDLGSALGSGTQKANSARSGGEYLFGWKDASTQLFTLGLAVPRWSRAHFPELPSVGRFEYKTFDPENWKPEYPNPAFMNRMPDDAFWAAKQIMAFHDDEIRAIVKSARYSDRVAEDWIVECLIQRRDKIGRAFFAKVLPLDQFSVSEGALRFRDLSNDAGFGGAGPYRVEWLQLDNATGETRSINGASSFAVPEADGAYRIARISSESRPGQTLDVTLRTEHGEIPTVVGIERRW